VLLKEIALAWYTDDPALIAPVPPETTING
jgi:hypothetical protein